MALFFTSDTHFFHTNIIKYCGRPFSDAAAMNAAIVANWNSVVAPEDTVYHLGDFAMGVPPELGFEAVRALRKNLNGHIRLYRGNHDRSSGRFKAMDVELLPKSHVLELEGVRLLLGHYPLAYRATDLADRKCVAKLCGHVHEAWVAKAGCLNVGVDVRQFTPMSQAAVLALVLPRSLTTTSTRST